MREPAVLATGPTGETTTGRTAVVGRRSSEARDWGTADWGTADWGTGDWGTGDGALIGGPLIARCGNVDNWGPATDRPTAPRPVRDALVIRYNGWPPVPLGPGSVELPPPSGDAAAPTVETCSEESGVQGR